MEAANDRERSSATWYSRALLGRLMGLLWEAAWLE